jgi:hypothetical protein
MQDVDRAKKPIEKSCFFFTMHKAASTFVGHLLSRTFQSAGYGALDISAESFTAGVTEVDYVCCNRHRLLDANMFYGPFRSETALAVPLELPEQLVVHVRDPRDCVVSMYYSICFSHSLPGEGPARHEFLEWREKYREKGIDFFCMEGIERNYRALGIMREVVQRRPDAVLSYYERLVASPADWFVDVTTRLGISRNETPQISSLDEKEFVVLEDKFSHKRQVTPGDYKRKLKKETQIALSDHMKHDLQFFGYSFN